MVKKCTRPLTIPMPMSLRTESRQRNSLGKTTTIEGNNGLNASPTERGMSNPKNSIGTINQGTLSGGMTRKGSFAARSSSR